MAERNEELLLNGVDIYFENGGGEILESALTNLKQGVRIVMCSCISEYTRELPSRLKNNEFLRNTNADTRGFFVDNHVHEYEKAKAGIVQWIKAGKLRALVDIQNRMDKTPRALMGFYSCTNIGEHIGRVMPGDDIAY